MNRASANVQSAYWDDAVMQKAVLTALAKAQAGYGPTDAVSLLRRVRGATDTSLRHCLRRLRERGLVGYSEARDWHVLPDGWDMAGIPQPMGVGE